MYFEDEPKTGLDVESDVRIYSVKIQAKIQNLVDGLNDQ